MLQILLYFQYLAWFQPVKPNLEKGSAFSYPVPTNLSI